MKQVFKALKEQSNESLHKLLLEHNKALFALRMQRSNNQEGLKTHRFKTTRCAIARIKTALRQRQLEEGAS